MDAPVCLFLLRSVSFPCLKFLIDGSYYPWTYSQKEHARRTTCLYEIVSKIVLTCCSFRKADAKVVLTTLPTKHSWHFFAEFFVNKYNSLNMTTADKRKGAARKVAPLSLRAHAWDLHYSAAGASAAGASSTGASAAGAAAFSAAGLRERRVLAAFFTVLAIFSS